MEVKHTTLDGQPAIQVSFTIKLNPKASLYAWESELALVQAAATTAATRAKLESMDTDGAPLICDGIKWTSKGKAKLLVETPGGCAEIQRHVYQTSAGGSTRAPLDERAGLVGSCTPLFARVLASKAAEMPATVAAKDLARNHFRPVSHTFVQDTACLAATLAQKLAPESQWTPETPPEAVAAVVVSLDGAMLNTVKDGWRQALCGSFSLYDKDGKRLEGFYTGCGPGVVPAEGKALFFKEAQETLERLKRHFPKAAVLGLSDAASDLTAWLAEHTSEQLIDFHHAAKYLTGAAPAFARGGETTGEDWASAMRHTLRDEPGAAGNLAADMRGRLERGGGAGLTALEKKGLEAAARYFGNHHERMDYAGWAAENRPIGSGPVEAACKTIIKARMTQSGMRWGVGTAHSIISLRALHRTEPRWESFWEELDTRLRSAAL